MKRFIVAWLAAFVLGEIVFFGYVISGIPDFLSPRVYATPAGDPTGESRALLAQFPRSGAYLIPAPRPGVGFNQWEELAKSGPVALVHVKGNGPTPTVVFHLHYLLCVGAVTLLLSWAVPAFKTYGQRLGFVVLAGVVSTLFWPVGDALAFPHSWPYFAWMIGFGLISWLIMGVVLAALIKPVAARASSPESPAA